MFEEFIFIQMFAPHLTGYIESREDATVFFTCNQFLRTIRLNNNTQW